jgi:hypothetical protein
MSYESFSLGLPNISRFSGNRARTTDMSGRRGVVYPSPFFDLAQTYLPNSIKALLKWCRYYFLTHGLINTVVYKLAEYPITELVIDERNEKVKRKWEKFLFSDLRLRAFQIEIGLDYYCYGICLVSLHYPFTKYLICKACGHREKAARCNYAWRNLQYVLQCNKCHRVTDAKVLDWYEKNARRIRLFRWNPEYVDIEQGFAGSDPIYTFNLAEQLKADLLVGKRSLLETMPDVFIEALRRNKRIRFTDDNLFVFKRPTISQKDNGWGMPLILPVLKDAYYMQILHKAQEAIAQEHIVPMRVLFPQGGSNTSDPYTTMDLGNWRARIEQEIAKWKYDNNYIPILPLPMGHQSIGGDGKALALDQELLMKADQLVAGMGVPRELVFGGMQFSGSNVSMRIIENMFLGYRIDQDNFVENFLIPRVAAFMGWPTTRARMRRFKMADDLQRSAFYFQLNQAQKISDRTLLQEVDFDPAEEFERRTQEMDRTVEFNRKTQLAGAHMQGESLVIQATYQVKAAQLQQAAMPQPGVDPQTGQPMDPNAPPGAPQAPGAEGPGAPGGGTTGQEGEMVPGQQVDPAMPEGSTVSMENLQSPPTEGVPLEFQSPLTMGQMGGGASILALANRAKAHLLKMEGPERYQQLARMQTMNPQLYQVVLQMLNRERGSQANPLDVSQSPLPEQRPTRRAASVGL